MGIFFIGAVIGCIVVAVVEGIYNKSRNSVTNNYKIENEQLREKINKLEKNNNIHKSEIEQLKREIRAGEDKYEILKDNYDRALNENLRLKKNIDKIQTEQLWH